MTDKLLKGFETFRKRAYDDDGAQMRSLVKDGQNPDYFIISCIDSRANPGTILAPDPGTFFAFKAMGAVVRPYTKGTALAASLQFAFEHMKVPNLILLGHTQCGAVKALADGIDDPEIASFIDVAHVALERAKLKTSGYSNDSNLLREVEKQVVLQGLKNLKTYPSVAKALEEGRVNIRGWVFDMEAGALLEYDQNTKTFNNITDTENTDLKGNCCA